MAYKIYSRNLIALTFQQYHPFKDYYQWRLYSFVFADVNCKFQQFSRFKVARLDLFLRLSRSAKLTRENIDLELDRICQFLLIEIAHKDSFLNLPFWKEISWCKAHMRCIPDSIHHFLYHNLIHLRLQDSYKGESRHVNKPRKFKKKVLNPALNLPI